eukprot:14923268-Alexandrium_andersonii.AAC.1
MACVSASSDSTDALSETSVSSSPLACAALGAYLGVVNGHTVKALVMCSKSDIGFSTWASSTTKSHAYTSSKSWLATEASSNCSAARVSESKRFTTMSASTSASMESMLIS